MGREAELLEVVFYPFCSAVKFIRWKILADVTPERGWVGCLVFLLCPCGRGERERSSVG